jgi:hypothetical protein
VVEGVGVEAIARAGAIGLAADETSLLERFEVARDGSLGEG